MTEVSEKRAAAQRSRRTQSIGRLYHWTENSTAGLIFLLTLFTPWAFGTTQDWAIWAASGMGFTLGGLLVMKLFIRRFTSIRPPRWNGDQDKSRRGVWLMRSVFVLNVLVLLYTLISAANSRASFEESTRLFSYRDAINWLPHSYDAGSTWFVLAQTAGLSCFFWALRDWLLGKTRAEAMAGGGITPPLGGRLRQLLWVASVNGLFIAAEGIFQRFEGSGRLLFLVVPRLNNEAELQFGPWAYRSNAAQYFNLLWPVTIGFWFCLVTGFQGRKTGSPRLGSDARIILLLGAIVMAACPIMSSSRGGAIFDALLSLGTVVLLVVFRRRASFGLKVVLPLVIGSSLGFGLYLGWDSLEPRFVDLMHGDTSSRLELYSNARQMAHDFFVLGSGPGTFSPLYQLYRRSEDDLWEAYAHNDWLEVLITYGIIGESLILIALGVVLFRFFRGGGIRAPAVFYSFLCLAMACCLGHAFVDFPLRVYSVQLLFLAWCAVASVIGRRGIGPAPP